MRNLLIRNAAGIAIALTYVTGAVVASAQTPAPATAGTATTQAAAAGSAVEKPTYISIPLEITVNRPAADVWKRVGKFCDIAEWLQIANGCTIISGKDGEF